MVWYYLGGVTMFFFLVQIVTGILLLMYYQAGESTSYESMRYIVTQGAVRLAGALASTAGRRT